MTARVWIPIVVLLSACGTRAPSSEPITPEPARPAPPPVSRAPVQLVITNAGTSSLTIDASLGLEVIDVAETLTSVGLHLPPYACECACDVAECPCDGPPAPTVLAAGASIERTWDGALRSLRRGASGTPCHERLDPPPGRYLVVACDASGVRCGITEVELPAFEPITIAIPEVSPPVTCDDAVRVRRAARLALGAARLEGEDEASLADCDPAAAICLPTRDLDVADGAPGEGAPPRRCEISVSLGSSWYEVSLRPAAREGAPITIEAWFGSTAIGRANRIDVSTTRWAVTADGTILAGGVPRRVSHTHGGPPASIGVASFRVTNDGDVAVPLAVRRVEWLSSGPARDVAVGSPAGVLARAGTARERAARTVGHGAGEPLGGLVEPTVLPAHSTIDVDVMFAPQPAYVTWHQRFASRVTFDVGGRALVATVEHHVLRREPLRL